MSLSAKTSLPTVALATPSSQRPEVEREDQTLSPYFFVRSEDEGIDQLPLQSTTAKVNIAGVIADVVVGQTYKNAGQKPLEAIYIFPASTRAAVYGMTMKIGERTIVAEIGKREEARREYQQALDEGKSASLLEQQRPNVFQMNVGNILPGDVIEVELRYTELLVPTEGIYEFVYPTVVGPRYSNQPEATAPASEKWIENPYTHEGEAPLYKFAMNVELSAGMPIKEVSCTSHKVNVNYDGPSVAIIKLDSLEAGGNRDFILKYRLAGSKVETGLLLFEGQQENFFLLMMQPPARVKATEILPREYIFIVDVSGSMHGFPLDVSKKLLRDLIGNLRSHDKFNVLLFAGGSTVLSQNSLPATADNIQRAIDAIERERGGGGTELLPALERALLLPRASNMARTIVLATDGYVSVEKAAFDLIRDHLDEANMFAFGIGSSVNRYLIEGMARVGMGEPFVITSPTEAPTPAAKFRRYVESPVLTQAKIDFGEFSAYAVEPPTVPDMFAERPVIVFGKWRADQQGRITLNGQAASGPYRLTIDVAEAKPLAANAGLRYLWARHRIAMLSDYGQLFHDNEVEEEVTALGLQYNLLTAYTSFVAIDTRVRREGGEVVQVKQPLPLPQGVTDYAIGAASGRVAMFKMKGAPSAGGTGMLNALYSTTLDESSRKLSELEPVLPSPTSLVKVEIETVSAKGGITRTAAEAQVKSQLERLRFVYAKHVQQDAGLSGQVTVLIKFDSNGNVIGSQVINDEVQHQAFRDEIIKTIGRWQFKNVSAAGEVELKLKFSLQ